MPGNILNYKDYVSDIHAGFAVKLALFLSRKTPKGLPGNNFRVFERTHWTNLKHCPAEVPDEFGSKKRTMP